MAHVPAQVLRGRVGKAFHEYLPQDCDHLLDECMSTHSGCLFETHRMTGVRLCQNYDLSAESLFWKWEAVKHSNRETHRLDASNLQELKTRIIQEHEKPSRPTIKGSSARLSGMMSGPSGPSGYGPARIPRRFDESFTSGVKREDVDLPVPVVGSKKFSFSQVNKVGRRECEYLTAVKFRRTNYVPL
jgi:hypothetical protein